jgi:hypothetical protein
MCVCVCVYIYIYISFKLTLVCYWVLSLVLNCIVVFILCPHPGSSIIFLEASSEISLDAKVNCVGSNEMEILRCISICID